MNSWLAVLDSA